MKKGLLNVSIFLIVLIAAFSMFLTDNGDTSSISNNTSRGIILTSTARVKKTTCATEYKLPTTNPAAIVEHGIGFVYEFSDATPDTVLSRYKVPKDIDPSVQPMLQLMWSCPTAEPTDDSVNVRWEITYIWIVNDLSTDSTSSTTITGNYNTSDYAGGLVETNIQLAGFEASDDVLFAKIVRRADATPDTADSAAVNLLDSLLYYTSNKLGESL